MGKKLIEFFTVTIIILLLAVSTFYWILIIVCVCVNAIMKRPPFVEDEMFLIVMFIPQLCASAYLLLSHRSPLMRWFTKVLRLPKDWMNDETV